MISPGEVTPGRARVPARRIPVEDATRNGNRAPLHDVLGELHDGVAHRRGNGLGVCLELETRGGQETVHVWGQISPATPAFRRARSSSTAPWHTRTSARTARSDDSCEATEGSLGSEHVRPQQSSCVGVALPVSTRPAGAMMTNRPRMRRARQPLHCRGERAAAAGVSGRLRGVQLAEVRQHRHFLIRPAVGAALDPVRRIGPVAGRIGGRGSHRPQRALDAAGPRQPGRGEVGRSPRCRLPCGRGMVGLVRHAPAGATAASV